MRTCQPTGPITDFGKVLLLHDGAMPKVFTKAAIPARVVSAFQEMIAVATGLCCVPWLYAVEDAHGLGGFYVRGGGPIVIGHRDVVQLATTYVTTFLTKKLRHLPKEAFVDVLDLVYGRVLAHELGHALDEAGFASPFLHPEARADYFAGVLDALRGKDAALGSRFFATIGCKGLACTHPPHDVRATAYLTGYSDQVRALQPVW